MLVLSFCKPYALQARAAAAKPSAAGAATYKLPLCRSEPLLVKSFRCLPWTASSPETPVFRAGKSQSR